MVTLALGGDILPTRRFGTLSADNAAVLALVRDADLGIGNFEMPLTTTDVPVRKLLNIKAAPEVAADTPALGFRIVTIANNHAVDYGWPGLHDTRQHLQAAGLVVIGAGEARDVAAAPAIVAAGGRRVGVIAFSCLTPTGMDAAETRPGISPIRIETGYEVDPWYQMEEPGDPSAVRIRTRCRGDDLDWALDRVRRLRTQCDVLVVSVHWGFGSGEELSEYQRPLAEALVEAGADLVHGHHPHAIHAVGFHRGRPILFSAGTFIGQQVFLPAGPQVQALWAGMSPDGFVTHARIAPGAPTLLTLFPITLDEQRLPVPARDAAFERIAARLERLSTPHGARIVRHDGMLLAEPELSELPLHQPAGA